MYSYIYTCIHKYIYMIHIFISRKHYTVLLVSRFTMHMHMHMRARTPRHTQTHRHLGTPIYPPTHIHTHTKDHRGCTLAHIHEQT